MTQSKLDKAREFYERRLLVDPERCKAAARLSERTAMTFDRCWYLLGVRPKAVDAADVLAKGMPWSAALEIALATTKEDHVRMTGDELRPILADEVRGSTERV
jgi:hypothetical protein